MAVEDIDRRIAKFGFGEQKETKQPGTGLGLEVFYSPAALTNDEVATWNLVRPSGHVLTPDYILRRIGTSQRHISDTTPLEMGIVATCLALGRSGVDFTFFTTSFFPTEQNYSERLSGLLALGESHMDVFGAGSGFTAALDHIKKYEDEFLGERVVIVSSEMNSKEVVDLKASGIAADPAMSQLSYSDGAAAFAFTYGKDLTILAVSERDLGSPDCLKLPSIGKPIPPFILKPEAGVPVAKSGKIENDGDNFYRVVTRAVPNLIDEAVSKAGLDPQKIALIIPHQANFAVLEQIQKQLHEISPDYDGKVFINLAHGNFSSASIPIALEQARKGKLIKKGDIVVFAGFGAGLYSSVVVVQFLSGFAS